METDFFDESPRTKLGVQLIGAMEMLQRIDMESEEQQGIWE